MQRGLALAGAGRFLCDSVINDDLQKLSEMDGTCRRAAGKQCMRHVVYERPNATLQATRTAHCMAAGKQSVTGLQVGRHPPCMLTSMPSSAMHGMSLLPLGSGPFVCSYGQIRHSNLRADGN